MKSFVEPPRSGHAPLQLNGREQIMRQARKLPIKCWLTVFPLLLLAGSAVAQQGFAGDYSVHQGDANADGKADLYIQPANYHTLREPTRFDLTHRGVRAFLMQSAGDSYNIISFLSPAQIQLYAGWNELMVEMEVGDFNMDDTADIMLKGLKDVPGFTADLMVFASQSSNEPPRAVAPVTPQFLAFFNDMYSFLADPDYIDKLGLESLPSCSFSTGVGAEFWGYTETETEFLLRYGVDEYCYRHVKVPGENFSPEGVLAGFATLEAVRDQALEAGSRPAVILSQLIARILNVEVMEGVLEAPGELTTQEQRVLDRQELRERLKE